MRNFIFIFLALILLPAYMSGQVIKGKVSDKNGVGIPGAIVVAVDSKTTADTDFDGNFTIKAKLGETLKITMLGFDALATKAIAGVMSVKLQESKDTELKEVVVIGYGTAKKRDLTGTTVRISGKEVADKPNTNPIASLQGKVAGLSVVNSGRIGQEPDIRIRGTISRGQTKPLYVIDGLLNDNIDFVNPNDIETIDVLKDPSSLAVFGVRGANGVIVVTTKQAKRGKFTVNFNSSIGVKNIVDKPKLADASLFKTLYDERLVNEGLPAFSYYDKYTGNTNWIDEISNSGATVQSSNISISNGTDTNKLQLNIGNIVEEGLIKNERLEKTTFNLNDEFNVNNNFKIGTQLNGYKAKLPSEGNFGSALIATPIVSPYNADGVYYQLPIQIGGAQIGNPLIPVNEEIKTKINDEYRFVGNAFAELKFLKDFTFRYAFMGDLDVKKGRGYIPLIDVYAAETNQVVPYAGRTLTNVNQYNSNEQKWQQDALLTYQKSFGLHNFTALVGRTVSYQKYENINGSVNGKINNPIPNDPRWWYLNVFPFGNSETRISNSEQWDRATTSNLARLLYNYDGKYIFNASFRRDGSSELAPVNRFQNFWSLGGAWEVTKEKFMENQKVFNYLKIKGSYGELGNQYTTLHYPYLPNYTEGASTVFGNQVVPAYVFSYRADPNLKWESVTSYEGGIEAATLNNRLKFEATYFNKLTKDLLVIVKDQNNEPFYTNAGSIENKGFEFSASWSDKITDDFKYSISGNLTTLNNKVKSVYTEGYSIYDGPSITRAGDPIGSFYGYVVEGVYQSYADILSSAPSTVGSYGPGDLKYKDVNGDGKITPDDRAIIGNPTPDFTYGFSLNSEYKKFNFGIDFQGVYGNEIYRNWGNGSTFAQFNYRQVREDRWTGAGTSNWEPRIYEGSDYNKLASTYNIEDGSYLRLRNIQLGYTFDTLQIKDFKIQNLKIYVNAQNLHTWKKNSGFAPDAGGSATQFNVDNGGYPLPLVTSVGLSLTF
ncbi:SusC/RagA family TonB-linked outer membrane protein [Flavobacterium soyangense]|uniref:TonB-dependent receptor n=1 Tax=Flavobacterium soyangense TaxID=2023265 RepID=A0A930UCF4_9FLAO|nr:TonB-dependent receptor [Flavobacterium soyangense]MBF2709627.1 TonB-dependent receptor [Flavobacterium soyangense]